MNLSKKKPPNRNCQSETVKQKPETCTRQSKTAKQKPETCSRQSEAVNQKLSGRASQDINPLFSLSLSDRGKTKLLEKPLRSTIVPVCIRPHG